MGSFDLTVFGETLISEFTRKHERSRKAFARFLALARAAVWKHMSELKEVFPATDFDSNTQTYIFDVGGNKYRLLAAIDFDEQTLTIESVMAHDQYDRR